MTSERPRWSWLLFPHLSMLVVASVLAANDHFPIVLMRGGIDKIGHFLLEGTLSLLAVGFFGRARAVRVVTILGLLSALEEASQAWFPARTVDAWDLTANLIGIVLGGLIATRLTRAPRH